MEVISILEDHRIRATNVLVEFPIGEFLTYASSITTNNPLQRKRVSASFSVYHLLRDDLKRGCMIPPLVLAINVDIYGDRISMEDRTSFAHQILSNLKSAIILDGLQRTYTILDAYSELERDGDELALEIYRNFKIRCEFYFGINKVGILYRMLTLNTGQTPMSIRHQIEILYSDYLRYSVDGIVLLRETDLERKGLGKYSFRDIIDGFTSYLNRDYLTLDRVDLLENIKGLEKLASENEGADIFKAFLEIFHSFLQHTVKMFEGWGYQKEYFETNLNSSPFGNDAYNIFSKSQVMTGLGAAIGSLKDKGLNDFNNISNNIELITSIVDVNDVGYLLINKLDDVRTNASKIGNAQREYFFYLFRDLFNTEGDSYLKLDAAIESAYRRYRQNAF